MRYPVIFLLLFLSFCSEKESKPSGSTGENLPAIVFLGDSLTAGLGLPLQQSYPSLITKKLAADNLKYRVINAGVSGDTTAAGLVRLPWYLKEKLNVKMLVISLGSNDALRGLSISQMKSNLVKIIQQTRKFNPEIKIFLTALETLPNMGARYRTSYARAFRQVARQQKVTLLPFLLEGVAGQKEFNQPDGIHPNAAGASRVADNVYRSLKPYLQ